jgi:hypothetical protein
VATDQQPPAFCVPLQEGQVGVQETGMHCVSPSLLRCVAIAWSSARSTRSKCPQWEVPRVGTPAPEVQATGVHRRGARVAPRRKQLGKQPGEAVPSSRGGAVAEKGNPGTPAPLPPLVAIGYIYQRPPRRHQSCPAERTRNHQAAGAGALSRIWFYDPRGVRNPRIRSARAPAPAARSLVGGAPAQPDRAPPAASICSACDWCQTKASRGLRCSAGAAQEVTRGLCIWKKIVALPPVSSRKWHFPQTGPMHTSACCAAAGWLAGLTRSNP